MDDGKVRDSPRGRSNRNPRGACPASRREAGSAKLGLHGRESSSLAAARHSPTHTASLLSAALWTSQGIQKLLQAEQEASEVIALAKQQKFARLKQAKAEAEAEIAAYKAQREAQFQVFAKERMGDSSGHQKAVASSTETELSTISSQVAKNKAAMIDSLMRSVTTVAL
eukprot:Transcript_5837.p2 GENE.Transcript_5837~~Transcript_5837.p2  ORF type:complete len:169 (-),score=51.00 Transcript_5837:171-677(-)